MAANNRRMSGKKGAQVGSGGQQHRGLEKRARANTLHPWEVAEPLRQFALAAPRRLRARHRLPPGARGRPHRPGLLAARRRRHRRRVLSAALLVTVSWKSVPVYDAPDIIYLAAWSPLIIAGAPVYSVDGRLAASAWRRLGPRADLWDLRRYVLRRGALVTVVVAGLTLLVGSLLGGAVRDADRVVVPGPGEGPAQRTARAPRSRRSPATREPETSPAASASPARGATGGAATPSEGRRGHVRGDPRRGKDHREAHPRQNTRARRDRTPARVRSAPAGGAPSTAAGPSAGGSGATGARVSGSGSGGGTRDDSVDRWRAARARGRCPGGALPPRWAASWASHRPAAPTGRPQAHRRGPRTRKCGALFGVMALPGAQAAAESRQLPGPPPSGPWRCRWHASRSPAGSGNRPAGARGPAAGRSCARGHRA
ncbi:hypothetical protein SHIRM173S_01335 [Streptomyces hirsutus]